MADGSLKQSINKAAIELLIMPISPEIKNQTKTFIDVFVDSLATGIIGLALIFSLSSYNFQLNCVDKLAARGPPAEKPIIPRAIGPIIMKIPEVDVKGCKPDNLVFTMCMLMPYNSVARTTQSACTLKSI